MPTRIRRRSAIVTNTGVAPEVRQAIADVAKFQNAAEVYINNDINPILAANDPNVEVLRLRDNTTYSLGYQSFADPLSGGSPSTREDIHNHAIWNHLVIRGGKGTVITRSKTNTGGDGWFIVASLYALGGATLPSFGGRNLVVEDVTFDCPVAILASDNVTFRRCNFRQEYAAVSLLIDDSYGFVIDDCEFTGSHDVRASITGIQITGTTGASGAILGCRSVGVHPVDVGVDCDVTTGSVILAGNDFSNYRYPTSGWECVGYDFTDSGVAVATGVNFANRGVVIT